MARTYGSAQLVDGRWHLDVEPHVAVRLKRLFGRVRQGPSGTIVVGDTDEVCRDLTWVLDRYPLQVDERSAGRLSDGEQAFRARDEQVVEVLSGRALNHGLREPVRPARAYQQTAADLVMVTRQLLLTDEVGLGKSFTSMLMLRAVDALPGLVVTLTHLPEQWEREIAATLPWLATHVVTSTTPYDLSDAGVAAEDDTGGRQPDVVIVPYSKLSGWAEHLAGNVRSVVFDEAQELRRSSSQRYRAAARVAHDTNYRVGATATPVYNYGSEIFNVLQVVAPGVLGERHEFLREWCDGFRDDHKAKVRDPKALGTYLREQGVMLGRSRRDVQMELPARIPIPHEVPSDPAALRHVSSDVRQMAQMVLDQSASWHERGRASRELDWRLRQATGVAKAPYVAEFVRFLREAGEGKVVLFGWHRAVYDIWMERLAEHRPVLYTGSETAAQKQRSKDAFIHGDADVLIMSLRSGAGLDGLQDVSNVAVFGELDWSPQVHQQCVGRLFRDGQEHPTLAYFLYTDSGSDPTVMQVLDVKRSQSEPLINPDAATFAAVADPDRVRSLATDVLQRGNQ